MKTKGTIIFSVLCVLKFCFASSYYSQSLIYKELYQLSIDLQARLYTIYLKPDLQKRFSEVTYFYGRVLQQQGKAKEALLYYKKFQKNVPSRKMLGVIGELSIKGVSEDSPLLQELKKSDDITVLANMLLLLPLSKKTQITLYKKITSLRPKDNFSKYTQKALMKLHEFETKKTKSNAKKLLKLKIPRFRYAKKGKSQNFFFDAIYYKKIAEAFLFLASKEKNKQAIHALLLMGKKKEAKKRIEKEKELFNAWEQACMAMRFKALKTEDEVFEWTEAYLEKYDSEKAKYEMIRTLFENKQEEIASMYLSPDTLKSKRKQKEVWYLCFMLGDKEMRDYLRKTIDNWWSIHGIEDENLLEKVRISRYLLGDNFITPSIRRLLAVNNPFHTKSKLLKKHKSVKVMRSTMLLYVASGRK